MRRRIVQGTAVLRRRLDVHVCQLLVLAVPAHHIASTEGEGIIIIRYTLKSSLLVYVKAVAAVATSRLED